MNEAQKTVKEDIVNVIKLGIDAAGYVTLSDYEVEQVLQNIYPKSKTNDRGQPIGDYPDGVPTQEEFEKLFAEPIGFGDEDDWLMISKKYSAEDALAKIQKHLKEQWGWTDGEDGEMMFPKDTDALETYDIGWGYDWDSYHYSEGGYWICSDENQVTKRFEVWGIRTQ